MKTIKIRVKAFCWSVSSWNVFDCTALNPGATIAKGNEWFDFQLDEIPIRNEDYEHVFGEKELFEVDIEIPATITLLEGE